MTTRLHGKLLEQSAELSRAAGVIAAEMNALFKLGDAAFELGDDREAEGLAQRTLARSKEAGWTAGVMKGLRILGDVSLARGDHRSATERFEASLAAARELGSAVLTAWALISLAKAAIERADFGAGRDHLCEALQLARRVDDHSTRRVDDHSTLLLGLYVFAALLIRSRLIEEALELVGAAAPLHPTGRYGFEGLTIAPQLHAAIITFTRMPRAAETASGIKPCSGRGGATQFTTPSVDTAGLSRLRRSQARH